MSAEEPRSDLCRIADSLVRIEGILQELVENVDWLSSQVSEINSNFDNITATVGHGNNKQGFIRVISNND